jgi:glycosyltransferase involved in cell wall biosynthesis
VAGHDSSCELSVIVPVRDDRDGLEKLLGALREQTLARSRYELIVVDDGSSDGSAEVAEAAGARVLRTPGGGGSYAARNLALDAASGRVLAFTDADCVPSAQWLERGLAALEESGAGMVAGHIEMPMGQRPSAAAIIDAARHLDQERAVRGGFCATANLFVRREIFESVGRFNDNLISGGDGEFGNRATAAGVVLRYDPDAVVSHAPRSRPRELARKAYRLGFGAAQQRRHAAGPLRERPHICRRPGAYVPHFRFDARPRFERRTPALTWRQQASAQVVEYFFVQLPIAFGNLAGTVKSGHG